MYDVQTDDFSMSHIAFFSYARVNLDPYLVNFFHDLCAEIAPATIWAKEDDRISFYDKGNLRLMEHWKTHIDQALQSSAVLVCITSAAFFNSAFCGKEYYEIGRASCRERVESQV